MKRLHIRHLLMASLLVFLFAQCVPGRQFRDLQTRHDQALKDNDDMKGQNRDLSTQVTELGAALNELKKKSGMIEKDTARLGKEIRKLTESSRSLNESYEKLLASNQDLKSGNFAETRKLLSQLQRTQDDLVAKEDLLKKTSAELEEKDRELKIREAKMNELQGILDRKDSAVKALKNAVADALLGFRDNGLTVEQKNGKVYVSLEERLLFATGSTEVDPKGQEALRQLAKVLEKKSDINIMVEGHTDDVPMKGSGEIKDNWDLSVMRATAVVKILLSNSSIDPKRLSAAGRGQFFPIDPAKTAEARKKNRRTEIILTPKLDELLKVLESN